MKATIFFLAAVAAHAQVIDLSGLDKLSTKATESTNINMDGDKLRMAGNMLSSADESQRKAKDILQKVTSVKVRTFEFKEKGAYASSDLDAIRKQLTAPNWSKIIETKEEGESTEIYMYGDGGKISGLTVISAQPRELTVVNIGGTGDLNALQSLIPNINSSFVPGKSGAPKPPPPPPAAAAAPAKD